MSRKTCEAMFVKLNSRYHRYPVRPSWLLRSVLVLAVALTAGLAAVTRPSVALAAGQPITAPFPRLGVWWPDVNSYSDANIARHDYVVLAAWTASHLPAIKAKNPDIIALLGQSACELDFYPARASTDPDNVPFAKASARWLLTQAGSTLTANVNASTTSFPVAATSASGKTLFAAGDFVVVDEEIVKVTAVGSNMITVTRGQVHPAASHSAGARIAAAIQAWPDSLVFDVTAACPRATVDSAIGPETWNEWNARQAVATVADPAWSGLFLDRSEANQSWLVTSGYARTIDPNRSNTVVTDYSAFNTSWNSGLVVLETRLRSLMGDRIVMGNTAYPNYDKLNGNLFELFPDNAGGWGSNSWHTTVVGPGFSRGSYLTDWMTKCPQPNLSTIWAKEVETGPVPNSDNPFLQAGFTPNYRKMRFGLTTALLGDGFFAYGPGTTQTNGHGFLWFDEYDNAGAGRGYLGSPLGAAYLAVPALATPDLLGGSGAFDTATQVSSWGLSANSGAGYAGTKTFDSSQKIAGAGSMRFDVTSIGDGSSGVTGCYVSKQLAAGANPGHDYTVKFSAKANQPINVFVKIKGTSDWVTFGNVKLDTTWQTFELTGAATGWDASAQIRFAAADQVGTVWIDGVQVQEGRQSDVWRRDFDGGTVLVNANATAATVNLNGTFRKIDGVQDPTVNDGSLVTAVTLPAQDGLVLLRPAEPPVVPVPDTTPPTTTITGVPSGWAKSDVTFSLMASDPDSPTGITTYYGLNSPAITYYSGPVTVNTPGTTTVSYYSVDSAGNVGPTQSATIRLDKVAPTIAGGTTTSPNGAGWFRNPVTVHFTASDALSGLAAVSPDVTVSSQGVSQPVAGSATDVAGNSASASVSNIKIDSVAPNTTDDHAATYTASATVHLTPTDATSGTNATTWTLDGKAGSGTTVATDLLGNHTLTYGSTDAAGNVEVLHTVTFAVTAADQTPPVTTISSIPASWSAADVTFSLSASDPDSPTGITTFCGVNGQTPAPYDGPMTVATEGTSAIRYYSVDALGNAETVKTAQVRIDKTSPNTTDDHIASYDGNAAIHLAASDAHSGLANTTWTLDSTPGSGTTVTTSVLGDHTLTYNSTDAAGNVETLHTATFTVVTPPKKPPVYRFYNRKNGSHFYTASTAEKNSVVANLSATYALDGAAYTVNADNPYNNAPLYRFYNKSNGSHFYTASESEKNAILANSSATYALDGAAYNVCLKPVEGAVTVYRFYNKSNGSHFYTASESEKNAVFVNLSGVYTLDGPGFYLAP